MSMKAPKAPTPPDPNVVAAAQTASNVETATANSKLSAVDQYGPQGSTTFQRREDGTPYAQTVTLAPHMQALYNQQIGAAQQMGAKANALISRVPTGPMDLSGLPALNGSVSSQGLPALQAPTLSGAAAPRALQQDVGSRSNELQGGVDGRVSEVGNLNAGNLPALPGTDGFGAQRERVEGSVYDRAMSLMNPGMTRDRDRLAQQLSDRGIPVSSEAGRAELDRLDRAQGEQRDRLAMSAVQAGGAEQSRLFGLASQARGQLFGEAVTGQQANNAAAGQRFGQSLAAAQFGNQATGQAFGQDVAAGQFRNAALGQDFNQDMTARQFDNAVAAQNAQAASANRAQLFNEGLTTATFGNQARAQALGEAITLRNQPFNEAAALLQGSPAMQQPGFQNAPQYNQAGVDVAGIHSNHFGQQMDVYGAKMNQYNSKMGGMMNMGMGLFGLMGL